MNNIELGGVDYGGHSFCEKHTGKCDDEGLDLKISNQETLNQTEHETYKQRKKDRGLHASTVKVKVDSAAHAYKGCDGAHGYVDASGYHYDAHSAGKDDERRVFVENAEKSLWLQKTRTQKYHCCSIHYDEYRKGDVQ